MLEALKEMVFQANLELVRQDLVIYTWGNVSGIDRDKGLIVIKPSGVNYESMTAADMVVIDMAGRVVEGDLKPSSDAPTHIELYRAFADIEGVVHTHSTFATSWAQAGRDIPCYGTTHADYFYGEIPCTRKLRESEIQEAYETNTGRVIAETFQQRKLKALEVPGVIISNHGPFAWGKSPMDAVHNAKVIEEVAKMAYQTETLNVHAGRIDRHLLDKHYLRKHGKNAYYGQQKHS